MESNITNKQSFDELSYPIGPGDLCPISALNIEPDPISPWSTGHADHLL